MTVFKLSSQNIKGKFLKPDNINSDVFKQIHEDENLIFVGEDTKKNLREYIESSTEENAKTLWKSLLIDSICLLKINDAREKLYNDTKQIFEDKDSKNSIEIFKKNFSKIRRSSTYGIDELASYFDDFVEFESVLYGTGQYYRDHIHHVLQVWGLGIGLLWGQEPILIGLSEHFEISEKSFHFEIEKEGRKQISKSEIWCMWTIIALCHDLGYPLEKASQINQRVKKIVNHFGCLNFNELNFNFDILNTFLVEKYLNIISSKTIEDGKECDNNNACCTCTKDDREHSTKIQHKYHDKFSKSLEEYQHGAFSGLLLLKKLTYFLETDYAPDKETLTCEDKRQFYIRKEILRAICGHTCPKIYHLDLNRLPFVLIMCDELQEWGRPRFEDMKTGDRKDKQEIEIKKFSADEMDILIKYPDLVVNSENTMTVEEHIVRRKFKNLHYLLRSAKDDKDRNLKFTWKIEFEQKQSSTLSYTFCFDSKKDSYDMFKTTSDSKDSNEIDFDLYK